MDKFQGLKFFWRILGIKITNRPRPLTVIFNLTNRCNLRCRHCYAAYYDRGGKELSAGQIKVILTDLRANGCLRVSFSGGEPLLRVDLQEIIDFARALNLSVTVNTNGLLVPQKLELLKKVDSLAISLDGTPEHHDILRGPGTGEKVVRAIELAAKEGICVHTNTVLNRYNLGDIDYILDLARANGTKAEFALAISGPAGGESQVSCKPTDEEFRKALKEIIRLKNSGAPILFSSACYESVLNCWQDFSVEGVVGGKRPKGMPECPAGRLFAIVDADGTLCACPHLLDTPEVEKADILKVGVAQAWQVAGRHKCVGCYQAYHHEFGMLQNFHPRVVWNYVRDSFGGRSRARNGDSAQRKAG